MSAPRPTTTVPGTGTDADEVGRGLLARASAAVYRRLVLGVFLALTGVPTVVAWTALVPVPANAGLFVAAVLPVAPALSAALYAQRAWADEPDLSPSRSLWRGVRLNTADVLRWWVPVLVVAGVLVFNVMVADRVPAGGLLAPVCLVLLAVLAVWSGHLLVVTAYFSFRTRDALRVAAAELFLGWRTTLGLISLIVVALAVVVLASEAVLLLTGWAFATLLRPVSLPAAADITRRFVRPDPDAAEESADAVAPAVPAPASR